MPATIESKPTIDEDILESYTDQFGRIPNDLKYSELDEKISEFMDWMDRQHEDHQTKELYLDAFLNKVYTEKSDRKVYALLTGHKIDKITINDFIEYIKAEQDYLSDDNSMNEFDQKIILFASTRIDQLKDDQEKISYIKQLIENCTYAEAADDVIINFLSKNEGILNSSYSDELIGLLQTDTFDRYTHLIDKVVANPDKYLAAYISKITTSQYLNQENGVDKLAQLTLTPNTPKEAVTQLAEFLGTQGYKAKDFIKDNPVLAFALASKKGQSLEVFKKAWDDNTSLTLDQMLKYSQTYLDNNQDKEAFKRHILKSETFDKLDPTLKLQAIRELPLQSKTLKEFYLAKADLQNQKQKVPLKWPILSAIDKAVRSSEAGFSIQDGIEALTFVKNNLAHSEKELIYWFAGQDYKFLKSNEISIRQGQTNKKAKDQNQPAQRINSFSLFTRTMIDNEVAYTNQDKMVVAMRNIQDTKGFLNTYKNALTILKNNNESTPDEKQKQANEQDINHLIGFASFFSNEADREEFQRLTGKTI